MKKNIESILLLSCRSPFLNDSKIYSPMANLYLKSFINFNLPNVKVKLGSDNYGIAYEPMKDEKGNIARDFNGNEIMKLMFDKDGNYILDKETENLFESYDAIGISIMTPQKEEAHAILKSIKERWPEKIVIAGGPHVKHYVSDILKANEPYNYLVPLDGERALVGILSGKTDEFSHQYIRIGVKNGKHIITETVEDPRVINDILSKEDIRNAPRPDRTSEDAVKLLQEYNYRLGEREATTMMTARGCPEHCKFCEDAMTAVRRSSLENIKRELDDIVNLGYKAVYIYDDLFSLSLKEAEVICKELKKRDLAFRCNIQARYFTQWGEDFAKMFSDNGCYEVAFGAESGSQTILDNLEKRTTIEMNYKTVEYTGKYGIVNKAFILLGTPGETRKTLKETENFISFLVNYPIQGKPNEKNDFGAYVFYPYKGTQIRDSLDRGEDIGLQMLSAEGIGAYSLESIVSTAELSQNDLLEFRKHLIKTYRPDSDRHLWTDKFKETHHVRKVEYN